MSLLDITDLTVEYPTRFGTFTAIDGISLKLEPGEIHGLVARRKPQRPAQSGLSQIAWR